MELIKTPFTFEAVKLYRDFSTQDMNSNHAFFSVTAKAANTLEALCKQDNPWAPGPGQEAPGEGAPCPGWPENQAAAFRGTSWGLPAPLCSGRDTAATGPRSLVHSNLQRPVLEPSSLLGPTRRWIPDDLMLHFGLDSATLW